MKAQRNSTEISSLRLISQQIARDEPATPVKIVKNMGAIQAQDFPMAKLAILIRSKGPSLYQLDSLINEGKIIRTHLLRPTWHFVAAEDIRWMLELTAPYILASLASRHKQLELTADVIVKSNTIIEKNLQNKECITREEIGTELQKAGFDLKDNRLSHFLLHAELDGLICSGIIKKGKPTYALLSNRVKKTNHQDQYESLSVLARRYFSSRSPATLKDFTWWSGLPAKMARQALDFIKTDLEPEEINGELYWFDKKRPYIIENNDTVHLLPAYDEFLISYRDRTASMLMEHHSKAISQNGLFRPVIVDNGQIIGLWKWGKINGRKEILQEFFAPPKDSLRAKANTKAQWMISL